MHKLFLYSFVNIVVGIVLALNIGQKKIVKLYSEIERLRRLNKIYNSWLENTEGLASSFKKRGINQVAIYGMGELGKTLTKLLMREKIMISYIIDKRVIPTPYGIKLYNNNDEFPKTDVVIVTVLNDFDTIEKQLQNKVMCPIWNVENIFY